MHDDDVKFDDFLRSAAKDYKSSPAPRAGEIWAAIEPDVAKAIAPRNRFSLRAPVWIGVGIAAALVIGVGVGRWSTRASAVIPNVALSTGSGTPHVTDDSAASRAHTRATALEHLAESEVFLTSVRADLKSGRSDAERAEHSRELLTRTRLLLGSGKAGPEMRRLLEDLELLLAEIAALPADHSTMDKKLLDESMREGNILPRIRATLPAQQAGT